MVARYETTVHAVNRNSDYGIPVTVYAENRRKAAQRAVEIGWAGHASDAQVTFLRIAELPPIRALDGAVPGDPAGTPHDEETRDGR